MSLVILFSALILQASVQLSPQSRYILVFGKNSNTLVEKQWQLLQKDIAGLKERDVEVKRLELGVQLYKKYAVSGEVPFTIILVGKDGGVKYRSNEITPIRELFALIDRMPMRQAEMRKNEQKSS